MRKKLLLTLAILIALVSSSGCKASSGDLTLDLNRELERIEILPVSDFPNLEELGEISQRDGDIVLVWSPFGKPILQYLYWNDITLVSDTDVYARGFILSSTIEYYSYCTSLDEFGVIARSDNREIRDLVSFVELHLPFEEIDSYVVFLGPLSPKEALPCLRLSYFDEENFEVEPNSTFRYLR